MTLADPLGPHPSGALTQEVLYRGAVHWLDEGGTRWLETDKGFVLIP